MEGPADFEVSSRRLPEYEEPTGHAPSEFPRQMRKRPRRAATPRLRRKLAAIVAADVVGYSRLIECDEDGAVHRLRELQAAVLPIVEGGGGRLVNTAGDSMLLEFSSNLAALDGALAIQETVALLNRSMPLDERMVLRIGVDVGDVIVDSGDVFGEVVNVASRLEAIAEPGGVCVSHACHMQTKRQFAVNFIDLGEQRLKNIAEPVRVYAVRAPSAPGFAEDVPPPSAAPAVSRPEIAPPSSAQDRIAGRRASDSDSTSGKASAVGASEDRRQDETANVVPWPGRRRA
jgi:class 3 adenylate cyclase